MSPIVHFQHGIGLGVAIAVLVIGIAGQQRHQTVGWLMLAIYGGVRTFIAGLDLWVWSQMTTRSHAELSWMFAFNGFLGYLGQALFLVGLLFLLRDFRREPQRL
jgi:hypothetical protein